MSHGTEWVSLGKDSLNQSALSQHCPRPRTATPGPDQKMHSSNPVSCEKQYIRIGLPTNELKCHCCYLIPSGQKPGFVILREVSPTWRHNFPSASFTDSCFTSLKHEQQWHWIRAERVIKMIQHSKKSWFLSSIFDLRMTVKAPESNYKSKISLCLPHTQTLLFTRSISKINR